MNEVDGEVFEQGRWEGKADVAAMLRFILDPKDENKWNLDALLEEVRRIKARSSTCEWCGKEVWENAGGHTLNCYVNLQKERVSQEDDYQKVVQLAGCLTAAEGCTFDPAKPGDYGYSLAYEKTLILRRAFDLISLGKSPEYILENASKEKHPQSLIQDFSEQIEILKQRLKESKFHNLQKQENIEILNRTIEKLMKDIEASQSYRHADVKAAREDIDDLVETLQKTIKKNKELKKILAVEKGDDWKAPVGWKFVQNGKEDMGRYIGPDGEVVERWGRGSASWLLRAGKEGYGFPTALEAMQSEYTIERQRKKNNG